jgi:RNA polymerase sigma factor (sigma-70 family)
MTYDVQNATNDSWTPLVRQAQANDGPAMCQLLDEFENLIKSATRRFHVPFSEQADLLQEAYLGFVRAVHSFDPARSSGFPGYAKSKVREAVWQHVRVRSRLRGRELGDRPGGSEEDGASLLEQVADEESLASFSELEWRELLSSLSEREMLAVEKIVIDGLTMADLARMEGVSRDTVKTWKLRAFAKIREEIKKTRNSSGS